MNKNIVIVAESGSDITPEVAEKYGIEIKSEAKRS